MAIISHCRMVYVGKTVPEAITMKTHVTQCNGAAHLCVFNYVLRGLWHRGIKYNHFSWTVLVNRV